MRSCFKAPDVRFGRIHAEASLLATNAQGEPKIPKNHSDFAIVVASSLEPYLYIDDGVAEIFDRTLGTVGRWTVKKATQTKPIIRTCLLDAFREKRATRKDGKSVYEAHAEVPYQLKATDLQNTIADQVRTMMTREHPTPLDSSESCRRFLMDKNGLVYDCVQDVFIEHTVFLRLQRQLPWKCNATEPDMVWDAPPKVKPELGELFRRVLAFWQVGDVKTRSLHADPVAGQLLAKAMLDFIKANPQHCKLLNVFVGIYADDLDEALWKLRHKTADACAWSPRCEYTYQYGPGN